MLKPKESAPVIGGVTINESVKRAFQGATASLLNRENYIRGMSKEEKKMMEKQMLRERGKCDKCQLTFSYDCEICCGTGSL